ncbi:MAG TPA: PaaI family thioesterase [Solirubrobacteraceae bacterium]|jgi:uncharacterized protein (TIGR00369 family)|nr:PaaI family thioesterase [Solirubrobacteraceae bacterium]
MIDFVAEFVRTSPFGARMGLRLDHIASDRARLVLPFDRAVTTIGDVVHGGAVSTLVDVAATAAAWSAAEPTDTPRGATIGLTVEFLRAARGADLEADARVLRRGASICFCEVDVTCAGRLVAKGLVSYKLG